MIWFDLDNSPHVPLFRPILAELDRRNEQHFLTSRSHAQTEDLLRMWGMEFASVGVHGGRNKARKILNLISRAHALRRVAKGKDIRLAMSHGSRTHVVAAKSLGIPYVWMHDYEFQEKTIANTLADHILLPACIPDKRVVESGYSLRKVIRYDGLKEELYLKDFVPQPSFREMIGVSPDSILVTMRPPSVTANYHDKKSEVLFRRCLEYFSSFRDVHCLIVNRTSAELDLVPASEQFRGKVEMLRTTVDGLQLLWSSDIVVGAGGTMNREAALLGVPAYSIFSGRRPFVDEYLHAKGKLMLVTSESEVETIPVRKRVIAASYHPQNQGLANAICDLILDMRSKRAG